MAKKTTPHTAHRATKVARRRERATRPTPGAPPPDTTKRPNPRFAMPVRKDKFGRTVSIGQREDGLRDAMREVARGEESVTKAAKALGVSHRTAASLRGAQRLPAKERARIHRERLRAA